MAKPHKPHPHRDRGKPGPGAPPARERESAGTAAGAVVNRRAGDRLRSGHLWVYASDVVSVALPDNGSSHPPALLPVADARGILLGTALYSPSSQIALRMISRDAIGEAEWLELLDTRLRRAIASREPLLDEENDACRLCFSEADQLPGLIVDKYGSLVILQLLVKGLNSDTVRETCIRVLREELEPEANPLSIVERPDPRVRELEGLAAPQQEPLWPRDADAIRAT
ncbi:MAG TPA: SAM-dependent methyltransferase, partial [Terracidiphilus sp.]